MITIVLEDIRSVYNVGSIFRTMEGFGFTHAVLIGITPTPVDKHGNARKDFHKTALGAENRIEWKYYETVEDFISTHPGTVIAAIEIEPTAKNIREIHSLQEMHSLAILFGAEVDGVSAKGIQAAGQNIFHIPMLGQKESFNVSVAAGIVLYELRNAL
jgi:23S rRNA (guanosine2251-2'-O)-methyltransferase